MALPSDKFQKRQRATAKLVYCRFPESDAQTARARRPAPRRIAVAVKLHRRNVIVSAGAATAEWIARQFTEACGREQPPKYLIRDRDGAYGDVFKRRLRAMGIRDKPTAPRSPLQNGHCERLIGSIRRECLDQVVVLGERHLRHVLLSYLGSYTDPP
jgi:transposase InsO family protein